MMNSQRIRYVFAVMLIALGSGLMSQTVDFIPAGQLSTYSKYNINVSTASGIDGTGGFSFTGSLFANSTNYFVQISFDGGSTWVLRSSTEPARNIRPNLLKSRTTPPEFSF